MGNKKYNRGASLENDVANRLDDNGYSVVRAAGSGTTDRDACDVMAIDREQILLIECKTYTGDVSNVVGPSDRRQMNKLRQNIESPCPDIDERRDVLTVLALRQKGKFSPRYVAPFPSTHEPTGDEELLKELYQP